MALLVWRHGRTPDEVRDLIQAELDREGYGRHVTWQGHVATASVGLGAVLSFRAEITADAVVIDRCGGAAGSTVLGEVRQMLQAHFPGGEAAPEAP